jgi:hypothetical protein
VLTTGLLWTAFRGAEAPEGDGAEEVRALKAHLASRRSHQGALGSGCFRIPFPLAATVPCTGALGAHVAGV